MRTATYIEEDRFAWRPAHERRLGERLAERGLRSDLPAPSADLMRFAGFGGLADGLGPPLTDTGSASRYRPKDGALPPGRCGSTLAVALALAAAAPGRLTMRI